MKKLFRIVFCIIIFAGLFSCKNPLGSSKDDDKPPKNDDKSITSFTFPTSTSTTISESNLTIAVTVPYETNINNLAPSISHTGKSVSPASGVAQDFSVSKPYTVTAEDGSAQTYSVTVGVDPNPSKRITAFNLSAPHAVGIINESNHSIQITVPYGTPIKRLAPSITYLGSSVSPASNVIQDFSSPVTYTVTAADATTQTYMVSVKHSTYSDFNGDGYSDVIVGDPYYLYGYSQGRAYIYFGGSAMDSVADVIMTGVSNDDNFGMSVSSGDFNGDGYCDAIIGAPGNDSGGNSAGRAYIFWGGESMDNLPDVYFTGSNSLDYLGDKVASIGDVNGDGFCDIAISSPNADSGQGRVDIFYGSSTMDNSEDLVIYGEEPNDYFGQVLSGLGDVNADGFSDIIISSVCHSEYRGRVYIYNGGVSMNNIPDSIITGSTINANLGRSISTAGDVNNDGYIDIIIGAWPDIDARAYIYYGGLAINNTPNLTLIGDSDLLGRSVSTAGDINDDGYFDLVVGPSDSDGGSYDGGSARIYLSGSIIDDVPDVIIYGSIPYGSMGFSVALAGDVNSDGYDDVIIGAPANGVNSLGKAYILFGSSTVDDIPDVVLTGESEYQAFGLCVF